MKKILMTMVLGALIACLVPAVAQNAPEWQSTSTMKGAGSTLSPQVTAVGAANVGEMATTTSSTSAAKVPGGPRRVVGDLNEEGDDGDDGSPIGDALLPLMLAAAAYGVVMLLRRRKEA